jgi:hypothetical protein
MLTPIEAASMLVMKGADGLRPRGNTVMHDTDVKIDGDADRARLRSDFRVAAAVVPRPPPTSRGSVGAQSDRDLPAATRLCAYGD